MKHGVPFIVAELGSQRCRFFHAPPVCSVSREGAAHDLGSHQGCTGRSEGPGVKLGGTNAKSLAHQAEAAERAQALRSVMDELSSLSARAAADELNRRMVATSKGGKWHASSVLLVRDRLAAIN
jgi:hypothetical protein